MSFEKYLHVFSCVLVALGFSAIAMGGSYVSIACAGLVSISIYFKFHTFIDERLNIPKTFINISIVSLLAYSLYDIFFMSRDIVGNAIRFVIVLQLIKLFSAKKSRDWLQMYALSFLQLLASTVISESITFAIPFFIYLFFVTWTLTLFNLKTQVEGLNTNKSSQELQHLLKSRNVVKRSFFTATAALCSLILLFTFIVFFSIPRVSFKNFLRRAAKPKDVAGFSKEVDLGTLGNIQASSEIAFRVELKNRELSKKELAFTYWRSNSADNFDGKTWRSTRNRFKVMRMNQNNDTVFSTRLAPAPKPDLIEYTVYLESLDTPLLFFADHFVEARWDRSFLERYLRRGVVVRHYTESDSYEMHTNKRYTSDLKYTAKSSFNMPSTQILQQNRNQNYPERIKELYLQTPELSVELTEAFDSLSYPANVSPFMKAFMVQEYLKKKYKYTLAIKDAGQKKPLDNFFLNTKAGHCEYFSTAMIVMLRHYGIPARQVMGFRGGEYNPYGKYISVRQSDAHSWVEVYFPDYGWLRFDPTPGTASFFLSENITKPLRQFSDYLKIRWQRYIIDFNLTSQMKGLKSFAEKFTGAFSKIKSLQNLQPQKNQKEADNTGSGSYAFPIAVILLFLALLVGLARFVWWLTHKPAPYEKVLKKLRRLGFNKKKGETVDELKLRVLKKHPHLKQDLENINDYYNAHRFGKKSIINAQFQKLVQALNKNKKK